MTVAGLPMARRLLAAGGLLVLAVDLWDVLRSPGPVNMDGVAGGGQTIPGTNSARLLDVSTLSVNDPGAASQFPDVSGCPFGFGRSGTKAPASNKVPKEGPALVMTDREMEAEEGGSSKQAKKHDTRKREEHADLGLRWTTVSGCKCAGSPRSSWWYDMDRLSWWRGDERTLFFLDRRGLSKCEVPFCSTGDRPSSHRRPLKTDTCIRASSFRAWQISSSHIPPRKAASAYKGRSKAATGSR